ncbi:hypothetical protein [Deinococcus wulumuqiensis]|uniref:hypothetical protein n=1 Tax=Deinococcus wulumuqiensis TaxID=980427 RepID=UPI0013C2DD3A|nr:hypothetical protein [Deinococcus wulumuqiensis]
MNRPIRAFIQLAHNQDAAKWHERYLRGEVPDAVLYGYHRAERTVIEKQLTTDGYAARHAQITHELLKKGYL